MSDNINVGLSDERGKWFSETSPAAAATAGHATLMFPSRCSHLRHQSQPQRS